MIVLGRDLRVGDTIEVWWKPRRDTVMAIEPYTGPLDLGDCPRIAAFAVFSAGMTIIGDEKYEVLAREGGWDG